jgi:ATP-binding cassette subfamily C protein PrsD
MANDRQHRGVRDLIDRIDTAFRPRPAPIPDDAAPGSTPPQPVRDELGTALRACRGAFVGVGLFSGMINILMLTGAIFMLEVYDRVLPSRSIPTLVGLAILALVLYAGLGVLDLIRARVLVRIGGALDESLSGRVFSTLVRLPLVAGNKGEGLQPVRDLENVRSFLSGPGPTALFDLPWMPIYLVVIFAFHPALGFTALGGAVVLVCLTVLTEVMTRDRTRATTMAGATRATLAEASRRNAEVIAAMGMGARMEQRWTHANRTYMAEQRVVSDVAGGFVAVSKVLRMVLQSAILGVGAWLVINQHATAGIIIAAAILGGRALAPVDLAIAHWKGFVAARQSWQRLNRLLALLPAQAAPMALPEPRASVAVQGLAVAAPGLQKPIVSDVGFVMEAGHGLGIIGPSGSGKSTLVRALVGAWRPIAGRIRLDGADLDQWPAEDLGRHIGYLPQDVELFDGTVAENICRFDPNTDAEAIIAAAKAAGVHDLIVGLRDGYGTQIGEQGEALSAGQRQRIALARALYRDPFLIVLDEPNSNLDAEGELALTRAMLAVTARGGIVVIVAHRPNMLDAVDRVLVLNQGRVQAFGPKDEVFARLFPGLKPVAIAGRHSSPDGERRIGA